MSITMKSGRGILDGVETVVGSKGTHYRYGNVFGNVARLTAGPQVFLVEQGPGDSTAPHFHQVAQFQVFVEGDGTFGRKPIRPVVLHYADAWTSYGPITSGECGVSYFTARITPDTGARYMPESRSEKAFRSGRQFTAALSDADVLIAPRDDGLGAAQYHLDAGAALDLPAPHGAGRLIMVVAGTVSDGVRDYPQWSWGHVTDSVAEPTGALHAGQDGATVLCVNFGTLGPDQPGRTGLEGARHTPRAE